MFQVNLNKVGCGQKVQMSDVGILSKEIDLKLSADAGCTKIGETVLCSTIDRIGRMLVDIRQYCEIAILHSISDLLVSKVKPQCASVCIEYGPEFDSIEKMATLSKSLSDCFKSLGIELQNLHSVRSDYTHLTISVFGTREYPQADISSSGIVFLSRQLGASKMAVLSEIDDESSLPFVSTIVEKRFLGGMETDFYATDVTGFGLAGAAINLSERAGALAHISLSYRDIIHNDVLNIPVSCFEVNGLAEDAFKTTCRKSRAVSLCTEFAGPALFFVESENVDDFQTEFMDLHGWEPLRVGAFEQSKSEVGVTFSWTD